VARIAGAIVLETFALAVWNVGTRAPLTVLREAARAFRDRRALFTGAFSLVVGLIFVAAATILLLPAVDDVHAYFVPLMIFTFIIALVIEYVIGNDLRRFGSWLGGLPRPAGRATPEKTP
jgi:hypothetical protein